MKRFIKIVALFLIPAVVLYAVMFTALLRSGELASTQEVVDATVRGEMEQFGLAYRDDTRSYKFATACEKGASLLVLGTSRSMQLRGGFFQTDSFYNAGGSVPFLGQAKTFLERMPADKLPDRLILVLDQYFYNQIWANIDPDRDSEPYTFGTPDTIYALRRMITDLADGKYAFSQVLQTPRGVYGMAATSKGAGYYADGSYSYGAAKPGTQTEAEKGFADVMQRIAQQTSRFETGDTVSVENLELTRALLDFCKENNIAVTAFIPPYAPLVWQKMQETGNYTYVDKLLPTLKPLFDAYGYEVFDYTYLPETTDEQYIDGFHGSDRVYAAICARLADDSALLADVLDKQALLALFEAPGTPLTVDFQTS